MFLAYGLALGTYLHYNKHPPSINLQSTSEIERYCHSAVIVLDQIIENLSETDSIDELKSQLTHKFHLRNNYQVSYKENEIITTCSVCKLAIYSSEAIIECPSCHQKAHRPHFLEWLKIKGNCPICGINPFSNKLEKFSS